MKKILCLIFIVSALPAFAYQTGSVSRPNFSTSAATAKQDGPTEDKEKSSAPGQKGVQTRSFSSYSSRPGNAWRQGVQTKTVQTPAASAAFKDDGDKAAKNAPAALNKAKPSSAPKAADKAAPKKPDPQAAAQAEKQDPAAVSAETAAAMQQLQGLESLMGAMGGAGGSKSAAGGKAGGAGAPAGMPDLSALMNMAGPGNTGKK